MSKQDYVFQYINKLNPYKPINKDNTQQSFKTKQSYKISDKSQQFPEINKPQKAEEKNVDTPIYKKKYKPHTYKSYCQLQSQISVQSGSLGPNFGTPEWHKQKDLFEKRQEYGSKVNIFNNSYIRTEKHQQQLNKDLTPRQKGFQYALSIPKPRVMKDIMKSQPILSPKRNLDEFEKQHQLDLIHMDRIYQKNMLNNNIKRAESINFFSSKNDNNLFDQDKLQEASKLSILRQYKQEQKLYYGLQKINKEQNQNSLYNQYKLYQELHPKFKKRHVNFYI